MITVGDWIAGIGLWVTVMIAIVTATWVLANSMARMSARLAVLETRFNDLFPPPPDNERAAGRVWKFEGGKAKRY